MRNDISGGKGVCVCACACMRTYARVHTHARARVCVFSHFVLSDSLRPHGLQPSKLLCPWDFPAENPGVGCHFLLQGIFLTQVSDSCLLSLLHWQVDSLPLMPLGKPKRRYLYLKFWKEKREGCCKINCIGNQLQKGHFFKN